MRKLALAVALVLLAACHTPTAPAAQCDPTAQTHPDSMRVIRDSLGTPVLIVQWCGPITVE